MSVLGLGWSWHNVDGCAISETSNESVDHQQRQYWAVICHVADNVEVKHASNVQSNCK